MSEAVLDVRDLTVRDASGRILVHDVSLGVERGAALVVIGETGSGKSLVVQALLGLLPRSFSAAGTIRIGNSPRVDAGDRVALRQRWAQDVALVPQEPALALDPTARVGWQIGGHPSRPPDRAGEALSVLDLEPGTAGAYPFELSGGMAQRVLVASALTGHAELVVADEPTKGLDTPRRGLAVDALRRLLDLGRALLAITHDPAVARALGGTLAVMQDGSIVETGSAATVLRRPRHAYTRAWLAADPATWKACARSLEDRDPVLTGLGLGFAYKRGHPLFEDLDLGLSRGGILAFVGPSGSGKSTLGDVLLGLKRPTYGHVSWAGMDPYADRRASRAARRRYQKLHQDPSTAFLPNRTIRRQFRDLEAVVPGLRADATVGPLLERLKVVDRLLDRRPGEISGGEAQRLALARILLLEPTVIVADEPTSRLDPLVQKATINLLRELVDERGLGMILISHDAALVAATADAVIDLA